MCGATEENEPCGRKPADTVVRRNAINYENIAKYMGTKRKIVDVDPDLANRLAATEGAAVLNRAGGRGKVKVNVRLSDSSYSAVQSGISFLYR